MGSCIPSSVEMKTVGNLGAFFIVSEAEWMNSRPNERSCVKDKMVSKEENIKHQLWHLCTPGNTHMHTHQDKK